MPLNFKNMTKDSKFVSVQAFLALYITAKCKTHNDMEDNELFGERHEQEENGLYGRKHGELCDLHNVRRSCSNCKFFESFRDVYYDDMEPDDEGFCRNEKSPRYGNEGANSGYVCDFHNYA